VYKQDGYIHLFSYMGETVLQYRKALSFDVGDLIPDKRLYPSLCDYAACVLLAGRSDRLTKACVGTGRVATERVMTDVIFKGAGEIAG